MNKTKSYKTFMIIDDQMELDPSYTELVGYIRNVIEEDHRQRLLSDIQERAIMTGGRCSFERHR